MHDRIYFITITSFVNKAWNQFFQLRSVKIVLPYIFILLLINLRPDAIRESNLGVVPWV